MGKRARSAGITNRAVRAARAAFAEQDDEAAQVAQRVYNAIHEARASGEAGDVSPLLYGPLVVASEQCSIVAIRSTGLPETNEMAETVAAYFFASFMAGAQLFDFAHFERWRRDSLEGDSTAGTRGGSADDEDEAGDPDAGAGPEPEAAGGRAEAGERDPDVPGEFEG